MKRTALGVMLMACCALSVLAQGNEEEIKNLKIYYSSLDKPEANPVKEFEVKPFEGKIPWGHTIEIISGCTFQTLEGIGGAFNEIGGEAFLALEESQQDELMVNLFGKENAGFTYCRTAIGASDFGIDAYSYSEVANDYNMKRFSIERDEKFVLPYIQAAIKVNPELKIFGSPWSPPAWMKENGKMTGMERNNHLRSEPEIYEAYALYFTKYIKAYSKHGVNISRICIQNETDANTKYPSCVMSADQLLTFGKDYLKPTLIKNKLSTEVYAGTLRAAENFELPKYLMLEDADQLDGIGVQYTKAAYINDMRQKYPGFTFMHTEGKCYWGKNSVEEAEYRLGEIASYINAGCVNFSYWNIILNETTKSGWEWDQNSMINIDRKARVITYNPDYNVLYLISKYVKPGDVRVASMSSKKPVLTVKSPDGTVRLIIQNESQESAAYELKVDGRETKIMLPARAICAVEINN